MNQAATVLITVGIVLMLGLATDMLGRLTRLPRVSLLLVFGFVIGPSCLGILPRETETWFTLTADIALVMVGFLLGEKFSRSALREYGRAVLCISIATVTGTALVMLAGLALAGIRIDMALLLGGIALATDPAATADVVKESRAKGRFADVLLGIVAIDDAWGLIAFSFLLAGANLFNGQGSAMTAMLAGLWDLGGAVLLGIVLGIPAAFLSGRIRPGEPTLIEAVGIVLLCGGIALWLNVSFLLASMVLGAVVMNFAGHHERPFSAIENIDRPFMILFFVFAGASLHPETFFRIGLLGSAYILLRIIGRFAGAWLGGALSRDIPALQKWMGLALMPQAGVALGMALVATSRHPDLADTIMPVVIGSTVFFELLGPLGTRIALVKAGDAGSGRKEFKLYRKHH